MTHATCRLTAKNRDQLRNPTLGNRLWATFTFLLIAYIIFAGACVTSDAAASAAAAAGDVTSRVGSHPSIGEGRSVSQHRDCCVRGPLTSWTVPQRAVRCF